MGVETNESIHTTIRTSEWHSIGARYFVHLFYGESCHKIMNEQTHVIYSLHDTRMIIAVCAIIHNRMTVHLLYELVT